jgi:hypothetical protein
MQARADELTQTLERSELAASEVYADYQRILRELVANRVEATTKHVEKDIVEPLNVAINGNEEDKSATDNFPKTRAGIGDLRTAVLEEGDLKAKVANTSAKVDEARLRMAGLIKRLTDVLDKMEALQGITDLIKKLQLIETEQNRQKEILATIKRQLEDEFFNQLKEDKKP